jgi:8-oxo-dGTP pyrophosphatase MutT (NUDIX family)
VQAAGGLVSNEKDEILMIFRRGMWDLPKGKLDRGETLEDCAVREVEEETGLKNIKLIAPLILTYHTYHEGSKFILKESHWYKMSVKGEQQLVPQTEEDIHEIRWFKNTELKALLKKAYPAIADVLEACLPE